MNLTPKWHNKSKDAPNHIFSEIIKLASDLRWLTKKISNDVNVDLLGKRGTILEECENVIDRYWNLKEESIQSYSLLTSKVKRNPYQNLLLHKFKILTELKERRFFQLAFVLKKTIIYLLQDSIPSEISLIWAFDMINLYIKCGRCDDKIDSQPSNVSINANICSNMYPSLLLPLKPINFGWILQLIFQQRIEQNSLDMLLGLLKLNEQSLLHRTDSNCSSLEVLHVLTSNIPDANSKIDQSSHHIDDAPFETVEASQPSLKQKHIQHFLQNENIFLSQIILKLNQICPSVFGSAKKFDFKSFLVRGSKLIWSYVGIILDHIILWWTNMPMSCYSIGHIEFLQNWLFAQTPEDIPEPVYSTLKGFGEILSNFLCNNLWDQQFRLTLIASIDQTSALEAEEGSTDERNWRAKNVGGTPAGTVWVSIFTNLRMISNNMCPGNIDTENLALMPVSEQIPILHRIDHSVHSMRLWVKEQAKFLCAKWKMDVFFKILEHDIKICLDTLRLIKLPKLNADSRDILMLVCVALRAKLICEIDVNINKLKKTSDECIQTMSTVCMSLSLAKFQLYFPEPQHWQQKTVIETEKTEYVQHVLEQIYLPIIKATQDIVILKLILKIICEAWLDHIYKRQIRFSVNGALMLLHDFDEVREWIKNCSLLSESNIEKLSKHEVLRMCAGVGKILLRKPADVISIVQSPQHESSASKAKFDDASNQETQLPSEMFVPNQKNWLKLRTTSGNFPRPFCCD